jgi:hypothetical protein
MLRPRDDRAERDERRDQDCRAQASAYQIPVTHDSPKTFRDAGRGTRRDALLEISVHGYRHYFG